MKIYVAGPIRGKPNFNCDEFDKYAELLRAQGHEVFNPIQHTRELYGEHIYDHNPDGDEELAGIDGRLVFSDDMDYICNEADAVALMPGWSKSKGARAEYATAIALGIKVIFLSDEAHETYTAEVAAIVGDKPGEHCIMLGVGDGSCHRWKLSESLMKKLRYELSDKLDYPR